jgi:hypothetical protein
VHPLTQFLHRHWALERVQCLDKRGRDREPLSELLGLADNVSMSWKKQSATSSSAARWRSVRALGTPWSNWLV